MVCFFSLIFIFFASVTGCANKKKNETAAKEEKKKLNVYVDVKDKHSLNVIKFLTEEYKKENEEVDIIMNTPLDSNKVSEEVGKGGKADIIFTSRNTMLDLSKKGLLSDMSNFYGKNKISEKYYNVLSSYGRIGDKYYGVGLIPYSIEVFYSSEALEKMKITPPNNIVEVLPILKKISEGNMKVPVVLTEDLDIYNAFASILFSNLIDLQKLEEVYNGGEKSYRDLKEIQWMFDNINLLVKQGNISRETAEPGTENSISRLANGDIPLLLGISYYSKDIKEEKVGIVETYNMNQVKENIPVIVNAVACIPANTKNEEEVNNLMEYIFSEKTQKKLTAEGYITASKDVNTNLVGINKIITDHISAANNNSIVYVYNFPKKFQAAFESKIVKIISGKYTGNEWNEILDEMYK